MSMWMSRLRLGERIAPASDHPPRAPCLLVAAPQESKAKESIAALKAEVTHLQVGMRCRATDGFLLGCS
jgi:hypothetical protein